MPVRLLSNRSSVCGDYEDRVTNALYSFTIFHTAVSFLIKIFGTVSLGDDHD